ncbi:MAG: Na+/H+ antiporter NhaA [Hyphomicrobiales bacterium]|nr:Na+/H+ antiporter NhaA [Hyphomicrobiales bacterium]
MIQAATARAARLFRSEIAPGVILIAAAAAALIVANSGLGPAYLGLLKTYVGPLSVAHWISDGLMAVFFLHVGLEVKRELSDGELATWRQRRLPGVAALGGIVAAALIFAAINWSEPANMRGWAIPTATDIAFALGALSLVGSRAPLSLKVFLNSVAVLDDIAAIAIIALVYTAGIAAPMLALALLCLVGLFLLNRRGVSALWPYLGLGALMWWFTLQSGVHATLAGVALAAAIPAHAPAGGHSMLERLEHGLGPWVAFAILPLFAFANAGVSLEGVNLASLAQPLPLGIAAGLFLGKQIGVFLSVYASAKLGFAAPPAGASWAQVYGVALLCGIGFTMSLFIGLLAFPSEDGVAEAVKIGVLTGSIASAALGLIVLFGSAGGRRR